ncbi:hypothetical protein QQ054_11085 [Oscillatoria amoena NRMC-F 0135]|nr:hypothetical protein [Oscillatoria laete-virens]MDL5046577.1 hypothetical protein [Oscillatoria amoena NRMC-F 0135]MDL5053567.1 hypothetical protein [Oscillatoria laete-virens NRMC-F 0139]
MKHFICAICAVFLIPGCGKNVSVESGKPPAKRSHGHGEEEGDGADFFAGKGIVLLDETKQSIGLELIAVTEKGMSAGLFLTAQVYRGADEPSRQHGGEKHGKAYASARAPGQLASVLKEGQSLILHSANDTARTTEGKIWKMPKTTFSNAHEVEILLEMNDPDKSLAVGSFVKAGIPSSIQPKPVISIPRYALLKTAQGAYVFVENGGYLLRTKVQTGIEHAGDIEITSGLYEGDVIAVKPVETLYMIELRATKGGGHSH